MIMKNNEGITITELLVVLIVGAIMLLGVNAISGIGNQSHQKLLDEASIYNDISYAFKLIQSRVHRSKAIKDDGTSLVTGDDRFSVYTHSGGRDLMYYPDLSNASANEVIFSVSDTDMLNFAYTVNAIADDVAITLAGTKNEIPFNISTTIKNRRY